MKQPLVPVVLWYLAGILLADRLPLSLNGLLAAALVVAGVAAVWERVSSLLLAPLLVLAGATNLTLNTAILSPHDLRTILGEHAALVAVRGRLSETPEQRLYERDDEESWRTVARISVEAVRLGRLPWQPACGRVATGTPGVLPREFFAGQTVEVSGVIAPPKGPLAEGLFDYRAYLRRHAIYYHLRVTSTNDWKAAGPSGQTGRALAERFGQWAKAALARGLPVEDEPLRLLWAMTLGWKTALTGEVSQPFMRSGTMHIFAISGLHVALIAGILVAAFRVLRVPRGVCGAVVVPLLWFYTAVTGWQASAVRSTVMMTVIIAGWSLHRPSNLLNSLAAAGFIILLWDPQQIFQASFQLSFFVVLSLALFAPVLEKLRQRLLQPDPFLPEELRPRWQRWGRSLLHYVTAGATTSLAAWLGSIPLVAYYFHLFTPVSLLANLIIVPLSSAALACSLASLAVGAWWPGCGELFNHGAWFWMWLMVRVSEWAAHLPGAWCYVAAPSAPGFLFYYGTLISLMAGWLTNPKCRWWTAGALALLGAVWLWQWQAGRGTTRLTLLPLNGGEAIHFDAPGNAQDGLIDCGSASAAEIVTGPFLGAQGVNRLPRLLLTHGDLRHVGGAEIIVRDFAVGEVHMSEARFRSPVYRELQEKFQSPTGKGKTIRRGDELGPWTLLHPDREDRFAQADDNTMVLRGEFRGARMLLLSDLGKPGQNALMQREADLRAEIVVSGLPAQSEPLADGLVEAIQPKVIVITDAEYPATERASQKLRQRLGRHRIPVIYTQESGAVTVRLHREGWEIEAMDGTRLRAARK
jgi:ComEC/Rec2-related protein